MDLLKKLTDRSKLPSRLRYAAGTLAAPFTRYSRRLRASEERYRTLVQSSVDAIVTTDERGYITFVNRALKELIVSDRAHLVGTHISNYYASGIDEARKIMGILRREGRLQNYEMVLRGRDREIPILTSASLLKNEKGEVTGTLGVFTDITEKKKLEEELKKTQAHLIQTMKMRAIGDLVAGVAHSVNNPLMASDTILHVISESLDTGDRNYRRVQLLRECNQRIARIVRHLRDFSRQTRFDMQPIRLNTAVENALLISGQQLLNMNIKLEQELSSSLPMVRGDLNQLEQVFLDLIANARDAMHDSKRAKRLTIRSTAARVKEKDVVVISIADTGKGIPKKDLEKIFEPFFTTKEMGMGTGLGLSLCFGIIDEHQGWFEVESEENQGSTFKVNLPVLEEAALDAEE